MNHVTIKNERSGHVWLQFHGWQKGKPAGEIKPGDILMWNYGHTSEVLSIVKETAKTITITNKCDSGYISDVRFNKTRLVAIAD